MNPNTPTSLFVLVQSIGRSDQVVCVVDCYSEEDKQAVSCTLRRHVKEPSGTIIDISDADFENPSHPHFIGHFDTKQWMARVA